MNLDESINELNRSIREQEELEDRIHRTEWSSKNEDERTKLEQGLYIVRASKTILSILHRGFDKIKQDGKVIVLDEKATEKLCNPLCLIESNERIYKIAFENERGTLKDVILPGKIWLAPDVNLRIFGKKFIKDMGFDVDKPKSGAKSKIPKKTAEQIEQYVGEIDDNAKQFAMELNKLPMSEHNLDNITLQDIISKNEITADNSIKLIETSLTESV